MKMFLEKPGYQNEFRVCRFLQGYRLTDVEIEMFKLAYADNERIQRTIAYFQEGQKEVFEEAFERRLKGR